MARKPPATPATEPRNPPSYLTPLGQQQRDRDRSTRALVDQLTFAATDVTLHFDGALWTATRCDSDGVWAAATDADMTAAVDKAVVGYRGARRDADEQAKGA